MSHHTIRVRDPLRIGADRLFLLCPPIVSNNLILFLTL